LVLRGGDYECGHRGELRSEMTEERVDALVVEHPLVVSYDCQVPQSRKVVFDRLLLVVVGLSVVVLLAVVVVRKFNSV